LGNESVLGLAEMPAAERVARGGEPVEPGQRRVLGGIVQNVGKPGLKHASPRCRFARDYGGDAVGWKEPDRGATALAGPVTRRSAVGPPAVGACGNRRAGIPPRRFNIGLHQPMLGQAELVEFERNTT
jgi:hypothetical protein